MMNELKIKVSANQKEIIEKALVLFGTRAFRFYEPILADDYLTIDPFDFCELVTCMEKNFQDVMEIFRLKKIAVAELVKKQARCRKETSKEAYRQMLEYLDGAKPKIQT